MIPKRINVIIEGDGTPYGWKITDKETGQLIDNVAGFEVKVGFNDDHIPFTDVKLIMVPMKYEGSAQTLVVCPNCQKEIDES